MGDLFNNPYFNKLKESMDPEELKRYQDMGEKMYSVNVVDPENDKLIESIAYVKEALKSGLHYSLLEDHEKELLKQFYGEEWYTEYE